MSTASHLWHVEQVHPADGRNMVHNSLALVPVSQVGVIFGKGLGWYKERVAFQPRRGAAAQPHIEDVESLAEAVAVDKHLPTCEGALVGLGHVLVEPIGIVLVERVGGTCRRCLVEDVAFQPCRGAAAQKDVQAVESVVEAVAVDEHLPVGEGALKGLGHVLVQPIGIVLVECVGWQEGWRDEERRALHPQGAVAPYQHIQGVEANGQVAYPYLQLACGREAIGDMRIVVVVEPINVST